MNELEWTGERLTTALNNHQGVCEHLHRYALAQQIVKNRNVLDIASGEGYGSALMAKFAKHVTGVDVDNNTIQHSKSKYGSLNNISFKVGSADNIPLPNSAVDAIVSFETIEHHDKHDEMITEVKRVLVDDGFFLISSPEKSIYHERDPNNPFHVKELTEFEFETLLKKYFKNVQIYKQRFVVGSLITNDHGNNYKSFDFYSGNYGEINHELRNHILYNKPYFNIAVCSDGNVDVLCSQLSNSLFDGVEVVKNEISDMQKVIEIYKKKIVDIENSRSFRYGHFVIKNINSFLNLWKIK